MGTTGSNFSQCFRHLRRKGKALRERKPLSAKGLKRPGRLAAGKAEDHWLSRQGPAGPLADLAFPSVRTQLGLWDFTSHRRHFFSLGAQKGRKELKFHQAADKELPLKKVIWFRFAPNAKKLCRRWSVAHQPLDAKPSTPGDRSVGAAPAALRQPCSEWRLRAEGKQERH